MSRTMRREAVVAAALAVLVAFGAPAAAQSNTEPVTPDVAQPTPPAASPKSGGAESGNQEKPKRFPAIDEATKDMQVLEGLFTLYRFDPSDRQRDPERLLAKIPKNLIGEDLLFATSISRGSMAGWMWNDELFRWEIVGNQLKLTVPDTRYARPQNAPITDAVNRTYPESYLAAVPIVGMSPQGDVLIDLGPLLKSDLARVGALGGGQIRSELSTWSKVKVFPDNILIDVDLAVSGGQGGRSVGVSYAFRRLPKLGSYKPRAADLRVGYFLTAQLDWSKKPSERETFDRYINRWKLEKRDASLELSPPKEPIVFIIEKTVPIQWRRWVRDGILEWNRAFERIGYVDAIVVQQQTDDNEYASYDPEDARYNFFRWGVSGRAFAVGPSRTDPRTGQILDADILFDDAFVRAWTYEFDLYGPAAMADVRGPAFEHWLRTQPEAVPPFLKAWHEREQADPEIQEWSALEAELHRQGRCACAYGRGMQHQLALAHYALLATGSGPKKLPERAIGEAIREVVTHEVGHTLGLRHNFKASAWLSLDEIRRRRNETSEPTSASVMDYNPLLFFAGDKLDSVRHFVTPTIGPYDEWAIEYGYATPPTGKSEEEFLREVASRGTKPELQYATDEDTEWVYSPDPLVNRYDLSSSPIDYAAARIALVDELLATITEWALQPGEPRYYLTRAFDVLWSERYRNLQYVARLVSGQYFHRDQQGDPDARPPFVLVTAEQQRAALKYLGSTVFSADFFRVPPALLNQLAPTRWSHWGVRAPTRLDYPVSDRILAMQTSSLLDLLAPPVLERLHDAELKAEGPERFTVAELLQTLSEVIWPQLTKPGAGPFTDAQPMIPSIARSLQLAHLDVLIALARTAPGGVLPADVQSLLRYELRRKSEQIGKALANPGDFASRAHLTECKSRIDRVLEAQYIAP